MGWCYSYTTAFHATACLRANRRRRHRGPEERQPPADRADARQRSHCRPRIRFPPGARSDRRTRGSLRHLHPAERRAGDADRRPDRRRGEADSRRAGRRLMRDIRTLPEALARAAETDEGVVFLAPDGERRQTYAAIQESSYRVARSLLESGLKRGDVVALVINEAEPFLTALFGASMAGVVPASLYPPSAVGELPGYLEQTAAILRASGARAVVTSPALKPGFEALQRTCPDLSLVLVRDELEAPAVPPDRPVRPEDIAFVQFTSGSTSVPKGIALTHDSVSTNVQAIVGPSGLAIGPGDVALSWLPLFHDMGLVDRKSV